MFTRERLTRWTAALRANPEQQHGGTLANADYTKFCCLGKLCEVEGIPRSVQGSYKDMNSEKEDFLPFVLATAFGEESGQFNTLSMPPLVYMGHTYINAAGANDDAVPWSIIADHFDKYYPCSDEQQEKN